MEFKPYLFNQQIKELNFYIGLNRTKINNLPPPPPKKDSFIFILSCASFYKWDSHLEDHINKGKFQQH